MAEDPMLSQILGFLILGDGAQRIAVRYTPSVVRYPLLATTAAQRQFEKELIDKAAKQGAETGQVEIVVHKEYLTLYQSMNDVHLAVLGDPRENELLLMEVMEAFCKALRTVTTDRITKEVLLCKLDTVLLVFDEMVEGSMIYELDPNLIVSRAGMIQDQTDIALTKSPPAATTQVMHASSAFNQALNAAREGLMRGLFSGV